MSPKHQRKHRGPDVVPTCIRDRVRSSGRLGFGLSRFVCWVLEWLGCPYRRWFVVTATVTVTATGIVTVSLHITVTITVTVM